MVTSGDIRQQSSSDVKLLNGVKTTGCGVIDSRFAFQVGTLSGGSSNFLLKWWTVFTQIMPEACQPTPRLETENGRKTGCPFCGPHEMIIERVYPSIFGNMCQGVVRQKLTLHIV